MLRIIGYAIIAFFITFACTSAIAAEKAVNFQFKHGNPVFAAQGACAEDSGTFWNAMDFWNDHFAGGGADFPSDIRESDGKTSSSVTLALKFSKDDSIANSAVGGYYNDKAGGGNALNNLTEAYIFTKGSGAVTFTFSGLVAGRSYDIYVYGVNGGFNCNASKITIGQTVATIRNKPQKTFAWVEGMNYIKINVAADGDGVISGMLNSLNNRLEGALNGLQIVPAAGAAAGGK